MIIGETGECLGWLVGMVCVFGSLGGRGRGGWLCAVV
jgi:hypothetical protein